MGIIKKQALQNTIISYFGAVIGYVNVLILFPFAFSPEEIGLTKILQNAAALFVPIAQLGITTSIIRYFPFFKLDKKKKKGFFLYSIFVSLFGFFLFSACFLLLSNQIVEFYILESPLFIDYFFLIIPLTFFLLFFGTFESFANSNYKTSVSVFLRDIVLRLITTALALLFVCEYINFSTFIWFLVLGYGMVLLGLILYLFIIGEFKIGFDFSFLKKGIFREIFTYGLFVLLGSTGALLIANIDVLMIGSMLGLKDAGVYAIAFAIASIIDIPRRAIKQIVDPFVSLAIKNEDYEQIRDLYYKVSVNQLIIGSLFVLGIWVNIDLIFAVMPNGSIYEIGKFVTLILMLSKLMDMSTSINGEIIGYSKYYKFNIVSIVILAALTIITNLILIPLYGIEGAAMATLLSLLFFNISKFIFIKMKFGIQPFDWNTLKILLIGLTCYVLTFALPPLQNALMNIMMNSLFILSTFSIAIYLLNVSEEVNLSVNKIFNFILRR